MKTTSDLPELLREIPDPPKRLYYLGAELGPEPKVAIVGTRHATAQGLSTARKFAFELARAGVTIVSGLALGIDSAAHEGALQARGKTIAVLARGLEAIYPKQHEGLAKRIINAGGTILSEYRPSVTARQNQFLERNRIVSGLCLGVLAVEAPRRSGTLSTAKFAVEQNRELFVIPGNINNPNYAGSNDLIKTGAALVTEVRDILEPIGLWKETSASALPLFAGALLDENQKMIIAALGKNGEPMHTDEILAETNLSEAVIGEHLATLILGGIIKETGGRYYL